MTIDKAANTIRRTPRRWKWVYGHARLLVIAAEESHDHCIRFKHGRVPAWHAEYGRDAANLMQILAPLTAGSTDLAFCPECWGTGFLHIEDDDGEHIEECCPRAVPLGCDVLALYERGGRLAFGDMWGAWIENAVRNLHSTNTFDTFTLAPPDSVAWGNKPHVWAQIAKNGSTTCTPECPPLPEVTWATRL